MSTGTALEHAFIYSRDETGKKHRRQRHPLDEPCVECGTTRRRCAGRRGIGTKCCDGCMHRHTVPCKETRAYAPSTSSAELFEERTVRDGARAKALAGLTADERWVLECQGKLERRERQQRDVLAGDLAWYLNHDYVLVSGSAYTIERNGVVTEYVTVEGWEQFYSARLDYQDMAARKGCSVSMINKLVSSATAKLRALRF